MRLTAPQRKNTERWTRSKADQMAVAHGCWFDPTAAREVCEFFETFLRHSKGQWADEPFKLLKWQAEDVIKPLFGWKRSDGTRRYRTAYIEIPKKNGKSTLCAGLSLYGLIADDEPGAEIYSAAASRDQAGIVYREAATMVKQSKGLTSKIALQESIKHMAFPTTNSIYKALCAEAGLNEGLNIHFLIMDEMHAQKNDKFWNTLMYGGAARRQPLQIIITTAGVDTDSLCFEYHTKAMQIMQGTIQDDSFFAYVKSAEWAIERAKKEEKEQCWKDEKVWFEANPSLGSTISIQSFREDFNKAVQSPRLENSFKRYRLNIWTQQEERWLPMDHWAMCGDHYDAEDLLGRPCYAGLDLASVADFCALVLVFPEDGNALLPFFWVPEDRVKLLEEQGDPLYTQWVKQGFLMATAGNVADYDFIRRFISGFKDDDTQDTALVPLIERYDIKEIAYDRWHATQLVTQLQGDGLEMVGFGQGYGSMSAPSKEFERLILGHELRHNHHPVLTWCAGNVAVQRNAAEDIKPNKALSHKKIDGVVAAIMGLGRAIVREKDAGSVYDSRGLVVL